MMLIAQPLLLVLMIPFMALMRKFEYEADTFGVKYVGKEPAISAMKNLGRVNYANLTPHPLVVSMTHSHPTLNQRINRMEKST
jgi:STE24 endopeptidase